jgi:hypothetical protein
LDAGIRLRMEAGFGHDFSQVRVHIDPKARESARAVHAQAYTVDRHIVLGADHQPHDHRTRQLLAHELAHVIQQRRAPGSPDRVGAVSSPTDDAEREADVIASHVVGGRAVPRIDVRPVPRLLQRTCGAALGGPVPDCVPSTGDVAGEVFQFTVACDEFAAGEEERLQRFGQALPPGARLALHGHASQDGDAAFNLELSCHRANRASAVLRALPTRPQIVGTFKHGATPGPLALRRSVWVEAIPPPGEAEVILTPGQPGRLDLGQIERDLEARATEAARLRGELSPYSLSTQERYEYRKDTIIGRQEEGALLPGDRQAMLALQSYPSRYFPFDVVSTGGAEGIVLDGEYDLIDRGGFFIPPGKHPVRVTEATATSFTFTTVEGHFDPPGSTITFTTWTDADGNVHLEQRGVTKPAPPSSLTYGLPMILAPYLAGRAWDVQAQNLRQVLEAPPETGLRLR